MSFFSRSQKLFRSRDSRAVSSAAVQILWEIRDFCPSLSSPSDHVNCRRNLCRNIFTGEAKILILVVTRFWKIRYKYRIFFNAHITSDIDHLFQKSPVWSIHKSFISLNSTYGFWEILLVSNLILYFVFKKFLMDAVKIMPRSSI